MAEAGPSRRKRARYDDSQGTGSEQKGISSGSPTENLKFEEPRTTPVILDVEKFALARRAEISAMETAMKASRDSGAQRAFQSLPRHLRRRAASHNIRKLPKRLRAKAKLEMLNDNAKVLKKKTLRNMPLAKRRKLLRSSRLDILYGRQREKAWLETHIWHAKRMKMTNLWGYRLAYTPTEKAFRPSYRASVHGALLHDASYHQTIELKGHFEALKAILGMICDASAVPPSSKRYCAGLIGPAQIIWDTPLSATEDVSTQLRQLFIRFHPSILKSVFSSVQRALDTFPRQASRTVDDMVHETAFRTVDISFRSLCTFELIGPMASDAIKSCFRPIIEDPAELKMAWQNLPSPASVPTGTILSLDVHDPRLTFPPKSVKKERSIGKSTAVQPSEAIAKNRRFWSSEIRKGLAAPRYSKLQLDERRAKLLVPGTSLSAQPEDDRVPILLIQKTLLPDTISATSSFKPDANVSLAGWTVIVPSGWATAFWHSLVYAVTRVGGLRERGQQTYEAGCPCFPDDFPCTTANRKYIESKAKEFKEMWERRPPARRVNYQKLGTRSPWRPDFDLVITDAIDTLSKQAAIQGGEKDNNQADDKRHKTPPWLLSGRLVTKLVEKVKKDFLNDTEQSVDYGQLDAITFDLIAHERAKRQLGALPPEKGQELAKRAIVQVQLVPLNRGTPQANAMIYSMSVLEASQIRQLMSAKDRNLDAKAIFDKFRKDADLDGLDDEDDVDEEEDLRNEKGEEDEGRVFKAPSSSSIIGYVTTGNVSLARGHGFGIGSISLLALVGIMHREKQAKIKNADLKLLVLFRNPNSRLCRAATLEILA